MQKKRSTIAFLLAGTALVGIARAQQPGSETSTDVKDEIIVVGARAPIPLRELGSAVTVIDSETLGQLQTPVISDVLRDVPGLAVSRSGVPGTLTDVRIRGAEANQTLVIIDGIEANDPAGSAAFSFANLLAADLDRIEVLRGPQSAIYGSEAVGGVVNIITKAGEPGFRVFGEAQGGSFGTRQFGGGISGGVERFTGRVSV
ncbi:MAG: TonB-dependent receptor plug domain-containing protein, partial [Pseudomonadota bacterium]